MAGEYEQPKEYGYLKDLSIEELETLLTDDSFPEDDEEYFNAIADEIIQRERVNPTGRLKDVKEAWEEFLTFYCPPDIAAEFRSLSKEKTKR